jgi:hypothetical protein
MVELHDTLILDKKARRLSTGELAASVRCARTGLQDYTGSEVGKPGLARVTVYRPETEVMKRDSIASFAGVPVTIEHPREAVTTDNWKQYAVGEAGDEVLRDGEFIRVPILVRDAAAIRAIEDGKRQISMGYSCTLEFVDGVTPEGEPYQAIQRDIKINHLAVVDRARGGEALTVEDERTYNRENRDGINEPARRETSNPGGGLRPTQDGEEIVATKTILIDGYQFEADAALEVAVSKLQGQLKDAIDGRAADKTAHDKALATKDAEIDDLKTKVVDQAKIDALADAKAAVVADAKTIAGDKLGDTAGKSVAEVRRMACVAALGDAALKDKSDEYVEARFDTLKDSKPSERDPVRDALSTGVRSQINDNGASVRDLARASQF